MTATSPSTSTSTLPAPAPMRSPAVSRDHLAKRFGLDLVYVLLGFPVALASFVAMVTGLSLSAGLLVVWVGIPLLVLTLLVARVFAMIERGRLRARGDVLIPARYRRSAPGRGRMRTLLDRLRDPQAWLDVAHGVLSFPVALATWCLTVSGVATALGGITYGIWGRYVPDTEENQTLAELLEWNVNDTLFYTAIGVVAAVLIVPLVRLCATAQAGLAKSLLNNEQIAGLQARVETLTTSRAAAADAEVDSLRRLERDIHDGPQQRLVRLGMDLATAERRLADDPDGARTLLAEARGHTAAALEELRALSRGIAPPVLADRGLGPALADVASRSGVRVDLDLAVVDGVRLPARVENAVYFTVAEALTNVAKHARATAVVIRVRRFAGPDRLVVEVLDDGMGGADVGKGHGLAGLRDRLGALDGSLRIDSPAGGPTILTAEVPCGS